MSMDDDADDDGPGIGPPLPPDDRLWRHPSELTAWGPGSSAGRPDAATTATGRGSTWPVAAVAALVGAALCGGVLAVTGALSDDRGQLIVEKVAVTPVVSSPMLQDPGGAQALAEKVGSSVAHLMVTTDAGTAPASAVVFRDDGLLLTSAREVSGATAIVVVLTDGRRFDGELVGADLPTDVAVVAIDADDLTVAILGSADAVSIGAATMALGWPGAGGGRPSVATGVISALDRRLDVDGASLHGLLQTDAPIEAAWAGGPLVDASGAVIGITTDLAGPGTGFGFATPIDLARRMAVELIASGKVTHGWLGVECTDLALADAEQLGVAGGVVVRQVMRGSPAAESGLEPADVITDVGGDEVASSSGVVVAMRRHKPGEQVVVGYWRDGRRHETTITVVEHP